MNYEPIARVLFSLFAVSLVANIVLVIDLYYTKKSRRLWIEDRNWWKNRAQGYTDPFDKDI